MTVALVDSGVDPSHPALQGALVAGVDVLNPGKAMADASGHGTVMAGLIVGRSDRPEVRGWAADEAVSLLPIKVTDGEVVAPAALAAGIDAAVERKVAVICIPLASPESTAEIDAALDRAREAGILVVSAAGPVSPEFGGFDLQPAAHPWVVSCTDSEVGPLLLPRGRGVAARGARAERVPAGSAATGKTELMVDGRAIPIAVKGAPETIRGTSVACARAAALAALLRAARPDLDAARAREILVTAGPLPEGIREQATERLRRASREGVTAWSRRRDGPAGDLYIATVRRAHGPQKCLQVLVEVANLGGAPLAGRVEFQPPGDRDLLSEDLEPIQPGGRRAVVFRLLDVPFNEVALVRLVAPEDINPGNNVTRVICHPPEQGGVEVHGLRLLGRRAGSPRVVASARLWNALEEPLEVDVSAGVGEAGGTARATVPGAGFADVEIPFDVPGGADPMESPFVLSVTSGRRQVARAAALLDFGPAEFVPRLTPPFPGRKVR
ncbi:MAG: S8/S53 family peptidase [Planctomycetia bacterium]|nr:S8/S53 family peptidase [Planctomycetia bacterium]